jgi:hypothetical protein
MRLARGVLPKIFPALPPKIRFYPEYLKAIGEVRAPYLGSLPAAIEGKPAR